MATSSIVFGLIVTTLLFIIRRLYRKYSFAINIYKQTQQQAYNFKQKTDAEITRLIQEKLQLEEMVEHQRDVITNLRKAERKHVSTIKKLSGD
jgi:uncharacterized membrane protein YhiD involved in acid resistance